MSTKHRLKKYRMRRSGAAAPTPEPSEDAISLPFDNSDDGFGNMSFVGDEEPAKGAAPEAPKGRDEQPPVDAAMPEGGSTKRPSTAERLFALRNKLNAERKAGAKAKTDAEKPASAKAAKKPQPASAQEELARIKAEGLNARQLRIARRIAQKQGLEPVDDYDAIRLLRLQGTDPFKRSNVLDLVDDDSQEAPRTQLPQTIPEAPPPSTEVKTRADVARDVDTIRLEIARRRRKRMAFLAARLGFFVVLPTILAGYYFFRIATPMYSTHSEFVIQQADPAGLPSGAGNALSGTGLATNQDAVALQSFLQSRGAMLRLDEDLGFKAHFSAPSIDPIQRLDADATNEDAFRTYLKRVKIGYDPTEGMIKMEVVAADPQIGRQFSQALISYAEEKVDNLTQRLREDQMSGARASYEDAEAKVIAAQERVLSLQEQRGILSAELEVSSLMGQVTAFETDLNTERLRLQELLENPRPNETRVRVAESNIERLETLIEDLRSQMTESEEGGASLARISGELIVAEADLETRQMLLGESLQQLETARIEANRQVRYLSLGVTPVATDEASYPRAVENTLLALVIFGGIYLMISLTASILREQVSS